MLCHHSWSNCQKRQTTCEKGLSVIKRKPKKPQATAAAAVANCCSASACCSSRPWIGTGDGTTGTFHKSHSKRNASKTRKQFILFCPAVFGKLHPIYMHLSPC